MLRFFLLLIYFAAFELPAQSGTTGENGYLFPINPGKQNYLAGTMGEMRSSHFHAGIDIKTGGKVGLPVYATADGYISRIQIAAGGYGNALYMEHPNGTISVYAHLERFNAAIERYITEKRYAEETFEIRDFPEKDLFVYVQGEVIGYSGNTGSSSGPHLHFEIRDEDHRILDPLQFGFEEIKDDIAPLIKRIAFVTLDGQARVNHTFGRFEYDVIKSRGTYQTREPVQLQGNVGIEIYAYDLLNGVYNRNGIPETTLLINGDTIFSQKKNALSFSNQRNIVVHMDYPAYKETGQKFNKLFVDDGNTNDFYIKSSRGYFFDGSPDTLKILLKDRYGNLSTFESIVNDQPVSTRPGPDIATFVVYRNHLHFKQQHLKKPGGPTLYLNSTSLDLQPYRTDAKVSYYLWDLRHGLPDSLRYGDEMLQTGIYSMIPSEAEVVYYYPEVDISFKKYSLFDTLYLQFRKELDPDNRQEYFRFPHEDTPLKSNIIVNLKPELVYPDSNSHVYSVYGDRLTFVGGEWENGEIKFYTRELTDFTIAQDTTPPAIKPVIINSKEVYFNINDERSGIKSFRATLNGEFLLMDYEYKKDLIWSRKKDPDVPIKGNFVLEVEDNAGNINRYQRNLL